MKSLENLIISLGGNKVNKIKNTITPSFLYRFKNNLYITVEYDKSPEEAAEIQRVDLCYSLDNWATVKYDKMDYHSIVVNDIPMRNFFDVTVHGYETDTLQYCYRITKKNGEIYWANHNGNNSPVPLKAEET